MNINDIDMVFVTESGARYIVEGEYITRLSEKPFWDSPELVVDHRKFTWVAEPKIGDCARFTMEDHRGTVCTTPVVRIET